MLTRITRTVLRPLSLAQIRHVASVPFGTRRPAVARVYRELEGQFGVLAPPVALHAPSPELLAGAWIMLREALLVPGTVDRPEKEAVAAMISAGNTCPYCVTMHSPAPATTGGATPVSARPAPVPVHGAERIAVAVLLHYLNRMVNVFLTDAPLPPMAPVRALRVVSPVLDRLQRAAARDVAPAGASLALLPPAPVPTDLAWAATDPILAQAFSRAAAAADRAGESVLPTSVRALVLDRLHTWDGSPAPLSGAWAHTAVMDLTPSQRPAGRLALLTAFASYQVDDTVIDAFRAHQPEDAALIGATAWASMAAARQAGVRIHSGP